MIARRRDEVDSLESVLTQQRREIADAETLVSDVDFAFNLQMEEAISASLALNSLASSDSTPGNEVVPGDEVHYLAFLLEDIERLERERLGLEATDNLLTDIREDLDRRIHDQHFAREIMNIPDAEWEKDGNNYHRPYGTTRASSSSSSSSSYSTEFSEFAMLNSETFKLYCKGLMSEERVKDMNVVVGGVGVAICDSRDNLIFEVSKASEAGFGEGIVEIGALIEGLNSALCLDLKKVTFFCDDYMMYQYLTGRVQPIPSRISTLLNQVSVLQKNFIYCQPSLVACSDIKFAFKLARDAIVSQITWPVETSKGKKSLKETCTICYEDTEAVNMFSVDGCLHRYCYSCMKQHAEVKLLNGMDVKCPHEGCKSEVSIHSCGVFLDPKLVEIMSQRKKEASIAVAEKIYCPYPRCSELMSKTEALEYTKNYFTGAENSGARKCMKCGQFFCLKCKAPWHHNKTCYDYKSLNPPSSAGDRMLNTLAQKKHWRQCMKCSHMVELAEGCYHITCRCGYEFCYTCGAQWKNKKATCSCPIWDERNIIRDGRRQ